MTADSRSRVLLLHLAVPLALLGLQFVLPPFHHGMLARIMVFATYAIGYNVLLGYTGLMSLGHAMFFAAGMYGTGLTVFYLGFGALEAFLAGLAAGVLLSAVIGRITLRTTGVAFLIVTMMFAQVFYLATLYFNPITGGDQGLILTGRLQPVAVGGVALAFSDPAVKYNVALAVFVACLLLSLWLTRSPAGRVLIAIRENEDRTRMLGYNTFNYKLFALIVSGGISGAAGAAYTLLFSYVGSTFASILYSIYPLLWALLGGIGTTIGSLIGTSLMTYIVDIASGITSSYLLAVGAALVILIMRFPTGVMGGLRARWWRWLP
jgi:branched-chain amino acid transport system permease protein